LCHNRIPAVSIKPFDLQILFYRFEKQFNLPALLVNFSDAAACPVQLIRE
jgi:hypothetical protein